MIKKGAKPGGGGQVFFRCSCKLKLIPVNLTDPGKIKHIRRGIAYAMRVAPAICNRFIETSKGILLKYLPDVYIVSDHQKKYHAGLSPAFGLTLVAETITGTFLCGETCLLPKGQAMSKRGSEYAGQENGPSVPEDLALKATYNLLEEIYRGGCVDSSNRYLAFLLFVLNQKDVSRVLPDILSPFS